MLLKQESAIHYNPDLIIIFSWTPFQTVFTFISKRRHEAPAAESQFLLPEIIHLKPVESFLCFAKQVC